jgi:hypothetical protein
VALLLGVAELELEADQALPDEVGVVDELKDADPVDVELGVAVLDAVADADGDDEPCWVPLRGPVALGLAEDDAEDVPDDVPDEEAVAAGGARRRRGRARCRLWRTAWRWTTMWQCPTHELAYSDAAAGRGRASSSKPTRCRTRSES